MHETTVPSKDVLQKFYDSTIQHLITQGRQAIDSNGMCVYRAKDGSKCAAGFHIPDELYNPSMEGAITDNLLCKHLELRPFFPDLRLVRQLQILHDAQDHWKDTGGLSEDGKAYAKMIAWEHRLRSFNFNQ